MMFQMMGALFQFCPQICAVMNCVLKKSKLGVKQDKLFVVYSSCIAGININIYKCIMKEYSSCLRIGRHQILQSKHLFMNKIVLCANSYFLAHTCTVLFTPYGEKIN